MTTLALAIGPAEHCPSRHGQPCPPLPSHQGPSMDARRAAGAGETGTLFPSAGLGEWTRPGQPPFQRREPRDEPPIGTQVPQRVSLVSGSERWNEGRRCTRNAHRDAPEPSSAGAKGVKRRGRMPLASTGPDAISLAKGS